jgi:hypothetical protein
MVFFNPFAKHDHGDFPGVVVPLASAPAHSHPNPEVGKRHSHDENQDKNSLDKAPSEENGVPSSIPSTSHLTIEALRAEVEADIGASGIDSAYDRMFSYTHENDAPRFFSYGVMSLFRGIQI